MASVISYSLFGYGQRNENSFEFNSYLRGFTLNLRLARLVYPDWKVKIHTDSFDYFPDIFKLCEYAICTPAPLTLAMLWRLKPCFESYERVICRDLDSPLTLREAKCVKYWEQSGKAAHAITDSISHTIPMMGGMVGFVPAHFREKTGFQTWDEIHGYNWEQKGADQTFLNNEIYPKFAQPGWDSITQHYLKGMPNTWLSDYHTQVPEMEYLEDMAESNDTCGHIGAAGWYEGALMKFLRKHKDKFTDILEAEKNYPEIFYWTQDGTFD